MISKLTKFTTGNAFYPARTNIRSCTLQTVARHRKVCWNDFIVDYFGTNKAFLFCYTAILQWVQCDAFNRCSINPTITLKICPHYVHVDSMWCGSKLLEAEFERLLVILVISKFIKWFHCTWIRKAIIVLRHVVSSLALEPPRNKGLSSV